jgi:hypothetical protein
VNLRVLATKIKNDEIDTRWYVIILLFFITIISIIGLIRMIF